MGREARCKARWIDRLDAIGDAKADGVSRRMERSHVKLDGVGQYIDGHAAKHHAKQDGMGLRRFMV